MKIIETRKDGKIIVRRDPYVRVDSAVSENSRYKDDLFDKDRIYSVRSMEKRKEISEGIFADFCKSLGIKA